MKPTPNEYELLRLQIRLTRAKLQLNAAQLAHTPRAAFISPSALLSTAANSRLTWRYLALPMNKYLKMALAASWLWGNLQSKK